MPESKTSKRAPVATEKKRPLVVRVFVSYSHEDKGSRANLEKHLAQLTRENVTIWWDDAIPPGDAIDPAISRELRRSHLFIALLSPDYLASPYCWDIEYKRAMNRRARGTLRVVAIVVRPCDWKATRAKHFKALPKDGRPVSNWRSADEALVDVAKGTREVVKLIRSELVSAPARRTRAVTPKAQKGKAPASRPSAAQSGLPGVKQKPSKGASPGRSGAIKRPKS